MGQKSSLVNLINSKSYIKIQKKKKIQINNLLEKVESSKNFKLKLKIKKQQLLNKNKKKFKHPTNIKMKINPKTNLKVIMKELKLTQHGKFLQILFKFMKMIMNKWKENKMKFE